MNLFRNKEGEENMSLQKKLSSGFVLLIAIAVIIYIVINKEPASIDVQTHEEVEYLAPNPIIWADVPDVDVIRVDDTYYMVSTSMHMMPGAPIMASTDLVNWEMIGYPFDRLEENDAHNLRNGQNIYGQGAWATSLTYHNGIFYILFGALDTGKSYLFTTNDPAGEWERTDFNEYLHDPTMLFDGDKAYVIHGSTDIHIKELNSDYNGFNRAGLNQTIIESGKEGMEGARAYKIGDWYYITLIWWEQGQIRRQYVYRSDQIDGPYEGKLVLSDTMGYKHNGVAQGGFVDTPDGQWFATLFQDHDAVGRVPVFVPVVWEDGWPIYGDEGKVPSRIAVQGTSDVVTALTKSDEFYQLEDIDVILALQQEDEASHIEFTKNGDFSNGDDSWQSKDGAAIAIISQDGSHVAHVTDRPFTTAGIEQNFSWRIVPEQRYEATFRIKYTEGPAEKDFILTARKVSGGETTYQNLVRGPVKKDTWTEITGTFTIDDNPSSLFLFLETPWVQDPDPDVDLMDFYVDSVSVKEHVMTPSEQRESLPNDSVLGLNWQWNHNPDHTKWSLTERKGFLRLTTGQVVEHLEQARNTLTQRGIGPQSSGWISLDTSHMLDGDYAGLAAFQKEYGFIAVTKQDDQRYIVMADSEGEKERIQIEHQIVQLKLDFDFTVDKARFYYSFNGTNWTQLGGELAMRYTLPHFMGYRFALFNFATEMAGGYVDFDYFRFSDEATGLTTPTVLTAYLHRSELVVSKSASEQYEVDLLIDDFPNDMEVSQLTASLTIPEAFRVVSVEHAANHVKASTINYNYLLNNLQIEIMNEDHSAIAFVNQDGSKRLVTIKLKPKWELTEQMNDDVTVNNLEISSMNGENQSYDVSGANTKVNYIPTAEPLGKIPPNGNPLITHKFGADPNALQYNGRMYIYMTNDILEYDSEGNVIDNTYAKINKLTVISSDDLVNWTDHGEIHVAGREGAAKWASQSWAPAIAHKVIDGQDKFFLYFSNNGSNIGVLTSDSPLGPWVDPIGRPIIERATPGVENVLWIFDPAVLVDDDGNGYIYFGGGVPEGKGAAPETARVAALGEDMISIDGRAEMISNPYHFESSGIHKYNGKYYYTYSSNFIGGARPEGNPGAGEIAYMMSDKPMGPWEFGGTILKNPAHFFNVGGNNHQDFVWFNDKLYIVYHAQTVAKELGIVKGYRSTHINEVLFNEDGTIKPIIATYEGIEQQKPLNPYERVEAETIGWQAGIKTEAIKHTDSENTHDEIVVTDIHHNDWIAISNVDFGDDGGATSFTASVSSQSGEAQIELRLDNPDGELIGTLDVRSTGGYDSWTELTTDVSGAEGVHHLYLVFKGALNVELFKLDYWQFSK